MRESLGGVVVVEVLLGAAGFALDADEEALVDEAIGDGASSSLVVEELAPVFEGEVGGDDGGGALVALVEDLVEQVGAARVEGEVAELVDQEQVVAGPGSEAPGERVFGLAGDEVVDEICGYDEADAVAAEAGELAEGVGEMGLADAARADEDAVGLLGEEVEGSKGDAEILVDVLGEVEVVGVERGQGKDGRASEGRASTGFDTDTDSRAGANRAEK